MLTQQKKKELKSKAQSLKPIIQIGKDGLKEASFVTIGQALKAHELIKIKVLETVDSPKEELILDICARCRCEFVFAIGRVLIFYKENLEKRKKHV